MKKHQKNILIGVVLLLAAFALSVLKAPTNDSSKDIKNVSKEIQYTCNDSKTITAFFYEGKTIEPVTPGEPPIPGGSADVKLSDGREMNLKQTISADGVRYANADETFIFWSKGNGALVLENNLEKSYIGCIVVKPNIDGTLSNIYQNGEIGFTLRYPTDYTVDKNYKYQEFGPGKDISGIKFTIPASLALGTNLSTDSYLSVEQIPNAEKCTAGMFLQTNSENKNEGVKTIAENGAEYSYLTDTGAGAGNRYFETVYAFPYSNPCVAIRYYIHYGVFENYPAGTIKEFDQNAILADFNIIRDSLTLNQ